LQGSLRALYLREIMTMYLWRAQVLWKDFKHHVCEVTAHIRESAAALAEETGRPMLYLHGGSVRKEALIEQLRQRHPVAAGLVAILSAMEPCRTWFAAAIPRTRSSGSNWAGQVHPSVFLSRASATRIDAPAAANLVSLATARLP
jgi:hypothetical protein